MGKSKEALENKERKKKRDKNRDKKKKSEKDRRNDVQQDTAPQTTPVALTAPLATNLRTEGGNGSGGWSWGQVFAAAARVQPNEADLDDDFLKRTVAPAEDKACDRCGQSGFATIARMAAEEKDNTGIEHSKKKEEKRKRKGKKRGKDDKKEKKKKRKKDVVDYCGDETDPDVVGKKKRTRPWELARDLGCVADTKDSALAHLSSTATLRGRMVAPDLSNPSEQIMVLIDEPSGVVYSGFDRTCDGNMIAVGKVVEGVVVFDKDADRSFVNEQSVVVQPPPPYFPYPVEPDDHCETPQQAYSDIAPLLQRICKETDGAQEKMASNLAIYDPYFCGGSVIAHLKTLGFQNVYNKKEDCYKVWGSPAKYPKYDVFITNPPYSADHIDRLMKHVTSSMIRSRPWFLLMPTWVHKKDYYTKALEKVGAKPFYLLPKSGKRYIYQPPPGFRSKKTSGVHKKSSPFMSMWYIYGGTPERTTLLLDWCYKSDLACDIARSKSALRDLRRRK